MKTEIEVRIVNSYSEFPKLIQAAEEFLAAKGVSVDVTYKTHLALEEMCTNTIKYGYNDQAAHEIVVHLRYKPDALTIRIEDDGHEYNPLTAPEPDTSKPLAERPIGGLGILLVRKSVDSMTYTRKDGRNILEMGLKLAA